MPIDPTQPVVLFIDDDRLQRKLVPEMLGGLGVSIVTVANAEEAMAFLAERRADLILCDAVMPVTDGFQLCKRIKDDPALRGIPFAILTSLSQNVAERSLKAGADDFFLKRGDEALLRLRVRMLLEICRRGGSVAEPLEAFAGSRVLAASGSSLLLTQLALQLTPAGLKVETCPGAQEVAARLDGPPPSLLVLDSALENGLLLDVVIAVRKHAAWSRVPILVVADRGEEPHLDSRGGLIQDWVTKPLEGREARRRVQMSLRYAKAILEA